MAQRLWKDVIEIPRAVQASDFVLKLSEGVTRAQRTVDTYVVTRGVAESFDSALGQIGAALESRSSSGTYLHGSFGSGKSHFMAVLDLLLDQEHTHLVRKLDRLASVIVSHESWLGKKRLMMVPYHFLGAASMEERILGGYVDYIRRAHPDAPLPSVFVSDGLLKDAEALRSKLGDDQFLQLLGGDATDAGDEVEGWGDVGWDLESYLRAITANDSTNPEKKQLVSDLITNVFTSTIELAANARQGGYIGLDEGLQVISQHAASLGYDGVVLFLDELILWLSRHASDTDFIQREGQKLAKLVEGQHADRPIPIISFVARQRSLSDFVGEAYTGQEKASFDFSLDWLSGRFNEIRLEDRDLPLIVKERLLRPKDAASGEAIRQSFDNFSKQVTSHHREMMRTREVDDELFAKVYPFSPALVQALVALSTFLQRERTALRLLLKLLVDQREVLALGQVIPVGDLWDVVTEGQAPFSEALRRTYRQAVELWNKKLRPMLVEDHGFDPDDEEEVGQLEQQAWRDDARLLKTLLVAALVPQVEALRDMTISKLTALNYSAVTGFVPSMKDNTVASKLRKWASQVGEIRITEDHSDARVSLQLSTLDVEVLLDRVRSEDSSGSRKRKIRQLLYEWMKIDPTDHQYTRLQVEWRGARRNAKVYYRNVRELGHHSMQAEGGEWNILIDYPFDEGNYSPKDDQVQIESFLEQHPSGTLSLAWLPMFLSLAGGKRLGKLVKVEYVLDRFNTYAESYSAEERPALRTQLENLKSALRTQLKTALERAYGLSSGESELVDSTHNLSRSLHSLYPDFSPRMPGGADFEHALRAIFTSALEAQYPNAYRLPDTSLTSKKASAVLAVIEATLNAPDHRYFVEKQDLRKLVKDHAEAIDLGTMGETHFVTSASWRDRIERALTDEDREKLTVGRLRQIIEPPGSKRGTPDVVLDLIICAYALTEQMALVTQVGVEQEMTPGKLDDTILLERRALPDSKTWELALGYGEEIFGVREEFPLLSAASVEAFCALVEARVRPHRGAVRGLPRLLDEVGAMAGLSQEQMTSSARFEGARALERLFTALAGDPTERINQLVLHAQEEFRRALIKNQFAHIEDHTALLQDTLVRKSLAQAHSIEANLPEVARTLLSQARDVIEEPQHVRDLEKLRDLAQRLFDIMVVDPPTPATTPAKRPGATTSGGERVARTYTFESAAALREHIEVLEAHLASGEKVEVRVIARGDDVM